MPELDIAIASDGSNWVGSPGGGDSLTTCVRLSPEEDECPPAHAGAAISVNAIRATMRQFLDSLVSWIDIVHHPFGNREAVNLSPESLFV